MSYQYRLAIFDLDGTVLDTLADLTDAVNVALLKNGYPTHTKEAVCSFVGNGVKKLIERATPKGTDPDLVARVFEDFRSYYAAHSTVKTAPFAGIIELLTTLRARGIATAVLSNKPDAITKQLCRDMFGDAFSMALGERENEGVPRKPAPDAVHEIMRAFGVTREQTVYIGDSEVDIKTAENAGIDAILVSWGFREAAFLREQGAKTIADTAGDLEAAICIEN